jgi:hypothetical protein
MRWIVVISVLLALSIAGCGDSDSADSDSADSGSASVDAPATTAASPSPTTGDGYVAQVNALCEAMIPQVMEIRGDEDGDGGGDLPSMEEFGEQEDRLRPVLEEFDAKVDAIPVTESDRAAVQAFDDYRKAGDEEAAKVREVADKGDQQEYDEAFESYLNSPEHETRRQALVDLGIDCPAR